MTPTIWAAVAGGFWVGMWLSPPRNFDVAQVIVIGLTWPLAFPLLMWLEWKCPGIWTQDYDLSKPDSPAIDFEDKPPWD